MKMSKGWRYVSGGLAVAVAMWIMVPALADAPQDVATPSASVTASHTAEVGAPSGSPSPEAAESSVPHGNPSPDAAETGAPSGSPSPEAAESSVPHGNPSPDAAETGAPHGSPSPEAAETGSPSGSPSPEASATSAPSSSPSPDVAGGSEVGDLGEQTLNLELLASPYEVAAVCTRGQMVRIGLASQDHVVIRAAHGVRFTADKCSGQEQQLELLKPSASASSSSANVQAPIAQGTADKGGARTAASSSDVKRRPLMRCQGRQVAEVRVEPQSAGEPLELFSLKGDGSYGFAVYRGSLRFRTASDGKLQPINELPLETYLSGVVPSEVPARFHPQALRAMACVARTYTLSHLKRHESQGFDLCDSVHCHVYGGLRAEKPNVNEIVSSTAGWILQYGRQPIDATYHAVCGGWGDAPQNVWDSFQPQPYLQVKPDIAEAAYFKLVSAQAKRNGTQRATASGKQASPLSEEENKWRSFIDNPPQSYCQRATRFRWRVEFTRDELDEKLRTSLVAMRGIAPEQVGALRDIRVEKRTASGRVASLRIVTDKGDFLCGGDKVRWLTSGGRVGAGAIQSSLFYVIHEGERFVFVGGGWGHGVGLCQEGAEGRAQAGQSYAQILHHYYPQAVLRQLD